jgi:succinate dehydrogenase/fumarate reductase flavoprotein subunit
VTVWYESPAVELVQDCESGEVFGVIVEQGGKRIAVRALGGVVMAVGGFENNMDMQRNYFGHDVYPFGTPYNTGDGIRMVQKAGADLWHMRARVQSGGIWPAIKVPEFDTVFMRDFQSREQTDYHSWIDVAADDRRFYDETERYSATHHKEKRHGHYFDTEFFQVQPVHMIFDETVCKNFCLMMKWMTWNAAVHRYDWSEDNSAEVEKGWVLKADTLAGLAFKMGRNADQIIRTVDEYNEACRAGKDEAFGRHPDTLSPIENGPFYAVKIVGGVVCTSGGAKRNKDSEVLDYDGKPIPGLYEAGNLGSFISHLYQNGAYLTEAMITGRTAGRNAVLRA